MAVTKETQQRASTWQKIKKEYIKFCSLQAQSHLYL